MPPEEPQDQHSGAGEIDLDKILLPKKEISTDSAQRVNAGALLAQEQTATLAVPQINTMPTAPPAAPALPAEKKEEEGIRKIETYQGDIQSAVQNKNVSVVSIAAAEAVRRGSRPIEEDVQAGAGAPTHMVRNTIGMTLGALLIVGAVGLVGYALFNNAPLPAHAPANAPFMSVDDTTVVTLPPNPSAADVMNALVNAKNSVSLSLGLIAQLYVQNTATSSGATPAHTDAQTLLGALAPQLPETFMRDIQPVYVLGVHVYGMNQPFLVLKVDSYEQAYAGMLAWETTMKSDLSPLFTYNPAPVIQPPTVQNASTTPPVQFLQTGFIDSIAVNHDARVLKNSDGTIYFLWTFLDRNTIVITTNVDTLREVISRITVAPITTLPGQ